MDSSSPSRFCEKHIESSFREELGVSSFFLQALGEVESSRRMGRGDGHEARQAPRTTPRERPRKVENMN